jgi:hypothetical protein
MNSTLLLAFPSGGEWIFILAALGFIVLFPLIALIDILRNDFRGSNDKVIWVIIVLFIPILGSVLYYWIGTEQKVISRS